MNNKANTQTDQLLTAHFTLTPDLNRWVDAFLTSKRAEGVARKTIKGAYGETLGTFINWCEKRSVNTVQDITSDLIRQYLLWREETGHNPGGVHMHFRVVKTFLRWYEREEEPTEWKNPIRKVKAPKLPEIALEPADLGDVVEMLKACREQRQAERDKALLLTLLDTGLRATELTSLDLADLDQFTGTVLVRHGKGGKIRSVFLGEKARRAVRAYLKARKEQSGPLFTTETGGRLSYGGLRQIIRRCSERAGLKEPSLHAFRRAFALAMLRNGCDLLTLQRLMGHADLSLLRRYAKQTVEDLRTVHALASPADRLRN
jgi:integrase/recombinase XerC